MAESDSPTLKIQKQKLLNKKRVTILNFDRDSLTLGSASLLSASLR